MQKADETTTAVYWVNSEWLKTLDLEIPTTVDELYDVLVAFKNEDPNGNNINDEIPVKACLVSKAAGADFVKTSTGFSKGGATIEDIKLMRRTVGSDMAVKASGGIRDYITAIAMIEAGASRIGTSSGIKIIDDIPK